MAMNDQVFLHWIAERFIHYHGESPNVDFVRRLREIADTPTVEKLVETLRQQTSNKGTQITIQMNGSATVTYFTKDNKFGGTRGPTIRVALERAIYATR